MDVLLKAVACALICVIFTCALNHQWREASLLLSLSACCILGIVATTYLKPILSFCRQLQETGQINSEFLKILMKVVGVGLVGELAGLICKDTGNAALCKALELLTGSVILWLALPIFQEVLTLIESILGSI